MTTAAAAATATQTSSQGSANGTSPATPASAAHVPSVTPVPDGSQGGSGTGVANPGATGSTGSATASDWTAGLNQETLGYVQNKGFKDPASLLDSYRNLERALGAPKERILKLPEKADDPEWNNIYNKLGRPEKPEGYGIKAPDGQPDDMAKWARETFHGLGLTKAQAEGIAAKWNDNMAAKVQAQKDESLRVAREQDAALKKEWGAAHDQNVAIAKKAAVEFQILPDVLDRLEKAMGYDGVMRFMHTLGTRVGEATFVGRDANSGGGSPNSFGILTPSQAQSRIAERRRDADFVKRYTSGDLAAKKEMNDLHAMAYPSET